MAKKMKSLDWVAYTLLLVGGINWGLVAINSSYNLVAMIPSDIAQKIIYGLVGLSALYGIFIATKIGKK